MKQSRRETELEPKNFWKETTQNTNTGDWTSYVAERSNRRKGSLTKTCASAVKSRTTVIYLNVRSLIYPNLKWTSAILTISNYSEILSPKWDQRKKRALNFPKHRKQIWLRILMKLGAITQCYKNNTSRNFQVDSIIFREGGAKYTNLQIIISSNFCT